MARRTLWWFRSRAERFEVEASVLPVSDDERSRALRRLLRRLFTAIRRSATLTFSAYRTRSVSTCLYIDTPFVSIQLTGVQLHPPPLDSIPSISQLVRKLPFLCFEQAFLLHPQYS